METPVRPNRKKEFYDIVKKEIKEFEEKNHNKFPSDSQPKR